MDRGDTTAPVRASRDHDSVTQIASPVIAGAVVCGYHASTTTRRPSGRTVTPAGRSGRVASERQTTERVARSTPSTDPSAPGDHDVGAVRRHDPLVAPRPHGQRDLARRPGPRAGRPRDQGPAPHADQAVRRHDGRRPVAAVGLVVLRRLRPGPAAGGGVEPLGRDDGVPARGDTDGKPLDDPEHALEPARCRHGTGGDVDDVGPVAPREHDVPVAHRRCVGHAGPRPSCSSAPRRPGRCRSPARPRPQGRRGSCRRSSGTPCRH